MSTSYYHRVILYCLFFSFVLCGCGEVPYLAENQMDLHNKLIQKKMKVGVLPFTLNTDEDVSNVGFEQVDIHLTNAFTNMIWKKNKVLIVPKKEMLAAIQDKGIKYSSLNPAMEDLPNQLPIQTIVQIGKKVGANVLFLGTVRENEYDYEGGVVPLMPSLLAEGRTYKVGAQMMAVDIDAGKIIAFDFINNSIYLPSDFLSITGEVNDEDLQKGKDEILKRCGLALAYFAPMPEQREGADLAEGAVGLLNAFAKLKVSVDITIEDETWRLHPPGYFEERFAYSVDDYKNIR